MTEARTLPPQEVRLCWCVTFGIEETYPAEVVDRRPLLDPIIKVYIDADTGECVGADHT